MNLKMERQGIEIIICKLCGSSNTVRYGKFKGIQRWWCKDCKRKFIDNNALPNMRTTVIQVIDILSMCYEGMSRNCVRRYIEDEYGVYPSESTLYRLLLRFSIIAAKSATHYTPNVGDVWVIIDSALQIGRNNEIVLDVVDMKTHFLLSSDISLSQTTHTLSMLLEKAQERAGKTPRTVLADKSYACFSRRGLPLNTEQILLVGGGVLRYSASLVDSFRDLLKERAKVMRGIKNRETARSLLQGWTVHYNFFKPQLSLKNKTPAEAAGIVLPRNENNDAILTAVLLEPETSCNRYHTILTNPAYQCRVLS